MPRVVSSGKPSRPVQGSRSASSLVMRNSHRLVRLGAPSRPHVYFDWAPQRSPWASLADFRRDGGILVWPANNNIGAPPPGLKAHFPALVPEVPRSFARAREGLLPVSQPGGG